MQWDAHDNLDENHEKMSGMTDKPVAGLLADLKARGLLDETLVVWGGEFGRTPCAQGGGRGRDHNPYGFSMWMSGAGIKGGTILGATDEIGLRTIEDRAHQRSSRDDPSSHGAGPQAIDLSSQRPRRAPDRRRRTSFDQDFGLKSNSTLDIDVRARYARVS